MLVIEWQEQSIHSEIGAAVSPHMDSDGEFCQAILRLCTLSKKARLFLAQVYKLLLR